MTYLLDTNVLSETRKRRRNRGVTEWLSEVPPAKLRISVLTIGEIDRGVRRLADRGDEHQAAALGEWLAGVVNVFGARIAPVTLEIAREWGELSSGQPIHAVDGLIAATARVHGWAVVTRNTKDFVNCGARVVNPFTD